VKRQRPLNWTLPSETIWHDAGFERAAAGGAASMITVTRSNANPRLDPARRRENEVIKCMAKPSTQV
jgi:hypothetical protein